MTTVTTYLVPGFQVTFAPKRHATPFTQLPGRFRKAIPVRVAVLQLFNDGYTGEIEDLIVNSAELYNAKRPAVRDFVKTLQEGGYLTTTKPEDCFFGEPSGVVKEVSDEEIRIVTPASVISQAGLFLWYDHDGQLLLRLNFPEIAAVSLFSEPITVQKAKETYLALGVENGLNADEFDVLMSKLAGAELFVAPREGEEVFETPLFGTVAKSEVQALVDARVAEHDDKMAALGKDLVQVVPVNTEKGTTPASLGLVVAYAMEFEGGRLKDKYDFVPMFLIDEERAVARAMTPTVFIFSNYLWTVEDNLKISAAVKAVNPANITIHGGPSTPSYEHDCGEFFKEHPHVDIAVRGEGELTFAELLDTLDLNSEDGLDVLHDVAGITYRTADGVQRTGNRDRIADIDTIPSAYLMGLFEEFGSVGAGAVIESNRGCPYGCTFCDWGSATLSKVRRFDLERVYKELEWSAKHQIEDASIADANFGMLRRDVDIAMKIADLKRTYDFPRAVAINYAKNQVKYLRDIIKIMADVEILTEGKVSLQSMDATTLEVIDRSNIKLDKYNELATEFRKAKLPLAVEIMIGLPGATAAAFRNDLQECTNRDIRVMLNTTTLLPNSPMNEPSYREEHGIVATPGEVLKQTATYTREEWDQMADLKTAYYLLDSYGLLRYIARYVRRETGMGEVAFYDDVQLEVSRNRARWPVMSNAFRTLEEYMAPPGSWGLYIEEVHRYVVDVLGLPDNSALRTVLAVQHAHLPAADRQFPHTLNLEHDFSAWWELHLTTREEGHREDWEKHIPSLSEFGPGTLTIEDPNEICSREVGKPLFLLLHNLRTWEFESPVARPRVGATFS